MFQRFEGETNYPSDINHDPNIPYGATIYWSARHGAHVTTGPIGECYEGLSGTHGFCGFPTSSEQKAHPSPRGTTGRCQHFEGASIHWHEHGGAHPIGGAIRRVYAQLDGSGGTLGFPLTHEVTATPSPYGTEGVYQRFESTWDYPDDVVQLVQGIRCGATVYWSAKTGAHPTWAGIGTIYERLYGTGGVMGFPLSAEIPTTSSVTGDTGVHQKFEGGGIYWRKQTNSVVPVVGHVYRLFEDMGGVASTYGFPLSPEKSRPTGERLQAFEGGVISVISPS